MKEAFHDRLWIDHHERFSEGVSRFLRRIGERRRARTRDPLPLVGHAVVLALAVSLTSLTFALPTLASIS